MTPPFTAIDFKRIDEMGTAFSGRVLRRTRRPTRRCTSDEFVASGQIPGHGKLRSRKVNAKFPLILDYGSYPKPVQSGCADSPARKTTVA